MKPTFSCLSQLLVYVVILLICYNTVSCTGIILADTVTVVKKVTFRR